MMRQAGNYDLAIGAVVSTLLDPSDYFNAWYRTGGPQNYSFWSNENFDALVDQIDVRSTWQAPGVDPHRPRISWNRIRRYCRSAWENIPTSSRTT